MQSESKTRGRSNSKGAIYVPMHAERRVTVYPIEDSEMESLADINNNVAFWSAIGGGGIGLILSCAWDVMSEGYDKASIGQWGFFATAVGATIFAFGVAARYRTREAARLTTIRSQSQLVKL